MAAKPSEVLRKTKAKDDNDKSDDKKDSKKSSKNALIDFIAKNKNPSK